MKFHKYLALGLIAFPLLLAAQPDSAVPVFAGTWNVTNTFTDDLTCVKGTPGSITAYMWIVSQAANGDLLISVQGETTFPELKGKWDPEKKVLIVTGSATAILSRVSSWFKLSLNHNGELVGIRRFVSDSGAEGGAPCFADSQVVARKQ